LALLLISVLIALSVGELNIGLVEVLRMIFVGGDETSIEYLLITEIRLPRVILGIAVGGALSLAGVILQGIQRLNKRIGDK